MLASVVEHQVVELTAAALPGLARRVRVVVDDVERPLQLAPLVYELDRGLLDEVARPQLRQHVEPLEDEVGLRDERLADVESGELLTLEQLHLAAVLGEQRRTGRAGRPA